MLSARRVARTRLNNVPGEVLRDAVWVKPELIAEIAYAETTTSGVLRHARFLGIREDQLSGQTKKARPIKDRAVKLSHPDKLLFPNAGFTKRHLADYYTTVAEPMLAFLADRPLSLVRCPDGRGGDCFFQKHHSAGMDKHLGVVQIADKRAHTKAHITIDSPEGLVAAAQFGVLEFHLWGVRNDMIERPDRLVFDLDPGIGVGFAEVRKSAFELRDILSAAGLVSFPMVTGGKGVHVVVPLRRRHGWEVVTDFAKAVATSLTRIYPSRFVATSTIARRSGRIFIDWMRNRRGATAIAPFSPRARSGGPVAVPVDWQQLTTIDAANIFDLPAAADSALAEHNAWADYPVSARTISKAAHKIISDF